MKGYLRLRAVAKGSLSLSLSMSMSLSKGDFAGALLQHLEGERGVSVITAMLRKSLNTGVRALCTAYRGPSSSYEVSTGA